MFFKKKKVVEFDRNMTTAEENKALEKNPFNNLPPESRAVLDFLIDAEKISMQVDVIGGTVELSRRLTEAKFKLVLHVIDTLRAVQNDGAPVNIEHANMAKKIMEELILHMSLQEYEKFDEKYILVFENGETVFQKLIAQLDLS